MNPPKYVKISNLENSIEAQLLESILIERNIPHKFRSFYDTAYDGLFQFQKGWGEILAPEGFPKAVMDILGSLRSNTAADHDPDGEMTNGT
jgi:hypothetical protein